MTRLITLILLTILATLCNANPQKDTLIIVDKSSNLVSFKQSHSQLIKLIEDLGHTLSIKSADDSTLKLSRYGEFQYDNILLLCQKLDSFRGTTNVKEILEFIDSGRNVLLSGSNQPGSVLTGLANEVGFDFRETSTKREYPSSKLNDIFYVVGDLTSYPSKTFSFSGAQMKMIKSALNFEILTNSAPVDDIRPNSNEKYLTNVLIGAMQARNNARAIVSGSYDFFGDKAFDASKQANKFLTKEMLRWLFKEKSVLRYSQVQHKKINDSPPSDSTDVALMTNFEGYTIMDDIEYSIKIELFENGKWTPYQANDVQLEFVRIDPFVRQTMQRERNDGTYVARFKVPDVYGIYKFQVDYKNEGLTHLFSSTQVSVRPLRHNEYERYIYSAYPYYLSAFLMMAYLYIFSFVYLYRPKQVNK